MALHYINSFIKQNTAQPMDNIEKSEEKLISSIDLLNRSGLSRATLNNYINSGILPPPVIRKPNNATQSKARRIGYFPEFVLGTLNKIIQYKNQGYSMEKICQKLTRKPAGSSVHDGKGIVTTSGPSDRGNESGELFYLDENRSGFAPVKNLTKEAEIFSSAQEKDVQDLFKQHMPISHSFAVLVADLQDSLRICAEMAPEEYLKLISQIGRCAKSSLKKYVGIYGKHPGIGLVYYFLKDNHSNYLMNPVYCALELRDKMKELSDEWKQSKGWHKDFYLNIGINEGYEFFGKISVASTTEVITLGDTVTCALGLSGFARYGSIWTAKNLLTRLDEKERKKIRYGIRSGQSTSDLLIENTFSRMADLIPHDTDSHVVLKDIFNTIVTEIQNLR